MGKNERRFLEMLKKKAKEQEQEKNKNIIVEEETVIDNKEEEDEDEVDIDDCPEEILFLDPDIDFGVKEDSSFKAALNNISSGINDSVLEKKAKEQDNNNDSDKNNDDEEPVIDDKHPAWIVYNAFWDESIKNYHYPDCFTERDERMWQLKQEIEVFKLPRMSNEEIEDDPFFVFSDDHNSIVALKNPEEFYESMEISDYFNNMATVPTAICNELLALIMGKRLKEEDEDLRDFKCETWSAINNASEKLLDEVMQKVYHIKLDDYYILNNVVIQMAKMYAMMMNKYDELKEKRDALVKAAKEKGDPI